MKARFVVMSFALMLAAGAHAQETTHQFRVVGTFGNLNSYNDYEVPFWTETLPDASDGRLTAKIQALDFVGLPSDAVYEAVQNGVYDIGATVVNHAAGDDPRLEGFDIPGIGDPSLMHEIADAYRPHLEKAFRETYDSELLMVAPYTPQVLYCKGEIGGLADLAGKRVRASGRMTMDLIEALGGTGVSVTFAEVPVALDRGVIDCGMTGSLGGYQGGWSEVATHLVELPLGGLASIGYVISLDAWNALDENSQKLLREELGKLEQTIWAETEANTKEGFACNTGGECRWGEPQNLTLVAITPEDQRLALDAITKQVLPKWSQRCGVECITNWEASVGKIIGIEVEQ